jgi:hypothetical protein
MVQGMSDIYDGSTRRQTSSVAIEVGEGGIWPSKKRRDFAKWGILNQILLIQV